MIEHFAGSKPKDLVDLGRVGLGNLAVDEFGSPPEEMNFPGRCYLAKLPDRTHLDADLFTTFADERLLGRFARFDPTAWKADRQGRDDMSASSDREELIAIMTKGNRTNTTWVVGNRFAVHQDGYSLGLSIA